MISAFAQQIQDAHREHIWQIPLSEIDISNPRLHQQDTVGLYFERLRQEAPVHLGQLTGFGRYWSLRRYADIMRAKIKHNVSSSVPTITILDREEKYRRLNFISMDPPRHDKQLKVVSPIVAPANLARMEQTIHERTCNVLDSLPRNC